MDPAAIARRQLWQRLKQFAMPYRREKWGFVKFIFTFSLFAVKNVRKIFKIIFKQLYLLLEKEAVTVVPEREWQRAMHSQGSQDALAYQAREDLCFFSHKPLISVIWIIEGQGSDHWQETLESMRKQYNGHWQLCIAVADAVKRDFGSDPRIRVTAIPNSQRVTLWNAALSQAQGEYIGWIESGDMLSLEALYEIVRKINLYPKAELLYTDEDTVDEEGHFSTPFFKPDWSPESFLSRNYLGHFTVIKKEIATRLCGWRAGFEEAESYDFLLRATELTEEIVHIPKRLYHARQKSATPLTTRSGQHALTEAMQRRKVSAEVALNPHCPGCYTVHYHASASQKVSIIIPTKDLTQILKTCVDSLYEKTRYPDIELIVVSNNSIESALFALLEAYRKEHGERFVYYESNEPFNYSKLMNEAVLRATGDMLLFLNNDTEVITPDWINEMMGAALQPGVGVVGCKLLYPNHTIQHAGVVLGLKEIFCVHACLCEPPTNSGYFNQLNTMNNYSALTAACFMCRKELFNAVGGFDETLQNSYNDIDFCLKLREKGLRHVYLPHVELYHHECMTRGLCGSTQEKSSQFLHEKDTMRRRWPSYWDYDPYYSMHLSKTGSFLP
jgi:GT2 family glycosyltransferase